MMSENSKKVIKYLQENAEKDNTIETVANALGLPQKTVNGCFTMSVQRKNLGYREEKVLTATVEGKEISDKKKFLRLNEDGMAFNVDAVEAE